MGPNTGSGRHTVIFLAQQVHAALQILDIVDELGYRLADHGPAMLRRDHVDLYQAVTYAFTPLFQSDAAVWPWLRDRIVAPLSRVGPVARLQAQLMSGLFGFPLPMLGLEVPDYSAIAASMAARASSDDQS